MTDLSVAPTEIEGHGLLKGKVVLVTAAAGTGIGSTTARRALLEGADVVVSDYHERRLTENAGHSVSFTGLPVDRIDPRRVHPHEHLGGQRRRHGAFLDLEYRGVAEAVLNDGLHGCRCGVLGHFSTQPSRGKWQVYPFGIRSR